MKFILQGLVFLLLPLVSLNTYTNTVKQNVMIVSSHIFQIIQTKSSTTRRIWSDMQIYKVSKSIHQYSKQYNLPVVWLLATIHLESEFYYKAVSGLNRNGTRDYGLTQQNSRYYQKRCNRLLKRNCRRRDILDPVISIQLMKYRLRECTDFKGVNLLMCYNSSHTARNKDSKYRKLWLQSYLYVVKTTRR